MHLLACRDPLTQAVSIVPLLRQTEDVSVKFLVVEIQLLLDGLKGDGGMHEKYVEMRNKLAN